VGHVRLANYQSLHDDVLDFLHYFVRVSALFKQNFENCIQRPFVALFFFAVFLLTLLFASSASALILLEVGVVFVDGVVGEVHKQML
jgi:hypothetical protein